MKNKTNGEYVYEQNFEKCDAPKPPLGVVLALPLTLHACERASERESERPAESVKS